MSATAVRQALQTAQTSVKKQCEGQVSAQDNTSQYTDNRSPFTDTVTNTLSDAYESSTSMDLSDSSDSSQLQSHDEV